MSRERFCERYGVNPAAFEPKESLQAEQTAEEELRAEVEALKAAFLALMEGATE